MRGVPQRIKRTAPIDVAGGKWSVTIAYDQGEPSDFEVEEIYNIGDFMDVIEYFGDSETLGNLLKAVEEAVWENLHEFE